MLLNSFIHIVEYLYVFLNDNLVGVSKYDFLLLLCKETAKVNMVMSMKHKRQLLLYTCTCILFSNEARLL